MATRPHIEALEAQVRLITELRQSVAPVDTRTLVLDYEKSLIASGAAHAGLFVEVVAANETGVKVDFNKRVALPDWIADHLDVAETYWIAAEMTHLVEHAAQTFPDEALLPGDLPSDCGWATLAEPSSFRDRRGRRLRFSALAWWPTRRPYRRGSDPRGFDWKHGYEIAYFTDRDDPEDEVNAALPPELLRASGKYHLCHVGFWPEGDSIADLLESSDSEESSSTPESAAVPELEYNIFGKPLPPRLPIEEIESEVRYLMTWTKAFFRLIQQRVTRTAIERPDRATTRRIRRLQPDMDLDIRVITLRRHYEDNGSGLDDCASPDDGPVWSHRWIVGGHWRNQYYARLDAHRQIWIAPYVKGPEDRPLIVKDRVYRWTR